MEVVVVEWSSAVVGGGLGGEQGDRLRRLAKCGHTSALAGADDDDGSRFAREGGLLTRASFFRLRASCCAPQAIMNPWSANLKMLIGARFERERESERCAIQLYRDDGFISMML
jgi:hypothetical protein